MEVLFANHPAPISNLNQQAALFPLVDSTNTDRTTNTPESARNAATALSTPIKRDRSQSHLQTQNPLQQQSRRFSTGADESGTMDAKNATSTTQPKWTPHHDETQQSDSEDDSSSVDSGPSNRQEKEGDDGDEDDEDDEDEEDNITSSQGDESRNARELHQQRIRAQSRKTREEIDDDDDDGDHRGDGDGGRSLQATSTITSSTATATATTNIHTSTSSNTNTSFTTVAKTATSQPQPTPITFVSISTVASTTHSSLSSSSSMSSGSPNPPPSSTVIRSEIIHPRTLPRPNRFSNSLNQYKTEGSIVHRMSELRELYRRSLIEYRNIGGTFPYGKEYGGTSRAVWDSLDENADAASDRSNSTAPSLEKPPPRRRGRKRIHPIKPIKRDLDLEALTNQLNARGESVSPGPFNNHMLSPPPEPKKLAKSNAQFKNKAPGRMPSAFSTKPTPQEICFDANGHKSYKCLRCGRRFTHPPAFSQHKRFHGREAGRVAAAAALSSST